MYTYDWDPETGGLLLRNEQQNFSKEPRPVYYRELDILGFDRWWNYAKNDAAPYLWAEANSYFYRGTMVAKTKGGSLYTPPEIQLLADPEPNGLPLRPVDITAMTAKNQDLLEKMTDDAIQKIYNTYRQYKNKVDVFYVAFSGGKDSVVVLDLVQRALPHNKFKVLFGDTGMEFPDTYDVIKQTEKYCCENKIEFLRSQSDLDPEYTWQQFGPPSQTMRWCCSVHKTAPQIILLRKYLNNPHFRGMAITGIRGEESPSRSAYDDISLGEKIRGQYSFHPILEWSSAELYLYIYHFNLLINDTYKKGNSRAGCLVCPLAAPKNSYFKERAYSSTIDGYKSTTTFNDIILNTTAKELSNPEAIKEFMDIGGWRARRSGKELSIAKSYMSDTYDKGVLTISLSQKKNDWREWIKTVGDVTFLEDGNLTIFFKKKFYNIIINETSNDLTAVVSIDSHTQNDIYFMSALKIIFRKSAYCIGCRACEANCPNGYITISDGQIKIDNKCTKCRKCHDVTYGCLVADSMRLPKGERKMGSIDRYANLGVEYSWVRDYFTLKDEYWESELVPGSNKAKSLKAFLNDSEVTKKGLFSDFGSAVDKLGVKSVEAWALMLCNLAYTAEFNWWIKNINFSVSYTPNEIYSMLDETMSKNSRSHIVSAYRNIFISIPQLGSEIGLGCCDYEIINGKRKLNTVTRMPWQNPDPVVILYSLYKFAEACGDYYQFTLTRLLNHEVDSDGVSPTEIFGLGREEMERLLTGLSTNYPEFINASFTLGLDNITLRQDKTSQDVLALL